MPTIAAGRTATPAGTIVPITIRSRTVVVTAAAEHDAGLRHGRRAVIAVARIIVDGRVAAAVVAGRIGIGRAAAHCEGGGNEHYTSKRGFHDLMENG
jgi:hypothetical protein